MMTKTFHLCLMVGLVAVHNPNALADDASGVLNENSRMIFFDTPLHDVTRFLSDQHHIAISLAPGVDGSERVTFDAEGPLEALLFHLLHPMNLDCRVVGDSLLFAAPDRRAYAKGLRERAEQEKAERDQERETYRSLEAAGGRLCANELGWISDVELRGANILDSDAVKVRHFRRLSRLDLSRAAITDDTLRQLKGLFQLRELAVGGTSITDTGLSHLNTLRQLETLDITETDVSDDGLQQLANLPSLHTVYCKNARITTEGIVELRKSGARVRVYADRPIRPSQSKNKGP